MLDAHTGNVIFRGIIGEGSQADQVTPLQSVLTPTPEKADSQCTSVEPAFFYHL